MPIGAAPVTSLQPHPQLASSDLPPPPHTTFEPKARTPSSLLQRAWRNPVVRERLERFITQGVLSSAPRVARSLLAAMNTEAQGTHTEAEQLSLLRKVIRQAGDSSQASQRADESLRIERRVAQLAVALAGRGIEALLDIGCGSGAILSHLGERLGLPASRRLGADVVERRAAETHFTPVRIAQGRIEQQSNSIDAAMLLMVLHHELSPEALLKEAYRVLRPGGTLLVRESDAQSAEDRTFFEIADRFYFSVFADLSHVPTPHNFRSKEAWHKTLSDTGFEVEELALSEAGNPFAPTFLRCRKPWPART